MEHEKRRDNDEQLDAHSLPGTNQAGKGPDACDDEESTTYRRTGGARIDHRSE